MYLHKEKDSTTFEKFNDIIEGKIFEWEKNNTTEKVDANYKSKNSLDDYFLKIINDLNSFLSTLFIFFINFIKTVI